MPLTIFNTLLIIGRIAYCGKLMFAFLIWNTFLAVVPLYFSVKAINAQKKAPIIGYSILWLLFFPNAMYIITDLFHLTERPGIPLWYDLLLLFSCATNGLILGLLSLRNMDKILSRYLPERSKQLLILMCMILCGYGIYLGRFERWNSWDVITQPYFLISSIAHDIIHPVRNKNVWALSTGFGIWLYLLYRYAQKIRIQ